jgi:hypothetical protein
VRAAAASSSATAATSLLHTFKKHTTRQSSMGRVGFVARMTYGSRTDLQFTACVSLENSHSNTVISSPGLTNSKSSGRSNLKRSSALLCTTVAHSTYLLITL